MSKIISPDDYRYDDGEYKFVSDQEPYVWGNAYLDFAALCCSALEAVIMVGIPGSGKTTWIQQNSKGEVFFDATSLSIASRRPIIALAKARGCTVQAVYLKTPFATCCERNDLRQEGRRVPDEQMKAMFDKVEEPHTYEGFSVVTVEMPDDG